MRLRFGECVLDSSARELRLDGEARPLSPKAFSLLEMLISARPRALSKAEIRDHLWPRTFVSESSLARLVSEVRAALGDDARAPRFVRTAYSHGYSFCGEASADAEVSSFQPRTCRLIWGTREIPLADGEYLIGRLEQATVWIDSTRVSRRHASIVVARGKATVRDLQSKNGTFVCGQRVEDSRLLVDGDEILIGPVLLTFCEGAARSTETGSARTARR
jgi:DNA-binding winged helix-turn-helix (wHTH) protein